MIFQSRLTILFLLISVFAVMSSENKNQPLPSAETVWGGTHVRLVITSNGAEVEFDCAHGEIKGPFKTDAHGRFDVPGTFVRERGGPVRSDETESGEPVRYSGRIEGDKMSLTITLSHNNEKLDEFSLTRGSQGRLFKCK